MQEALPNKRVHVEPYHSGLWWRELLRGGITLLFALLMLFTFNFFIDIPGYCLILNGALEMLSNWQTRIQSRLLHLFRWSGQYRIGPVLSPGSHRNHGCPRRCGLDALESSRANG